MQNDTRSIIGVRHTVRDHFNVQTGFGKTIKNVINTWKGSLLWSSVMNVGGPWPGYRRGARFSGKT